MYKQDNWVAEHFSNEHSFKVIKRKDDVVSLFQPLVSIIIPIYNGRNYMREAIDSALNQTYPNIEVLVINDGSDDNGHTAAIAKSYGARIRYFEKANGGVASALNLGIKEMHGEYFAWLSHDDRYAVDKIEKQIRLLSKLANKTTIVSCGVCYINEEGQAIALFHPYDIYGIKKLSIPLFPLFHGCINGCALLVHRSHFDRVGTFDEALPCTQDYDLWFRMMRHQPLVYHPGILSMTRIHKQQGSNTTNYKYMQECDNLWISMLNSLTINEIHDLAKTKYRFYRGVFLHLQRNSYYKNAILFTWQRMQEALEEEYTAGRCSRFKYMLLSRKHDRLKVLMEYDRSLAISAGPKWKRWVLSLRIEGAYVAIIRLLRAIQIRIQLKP